MSRRSRRRRPQAQRSEVVIDVVIGGSVPLAPVDADDRPDVGDGRFRDDRGDLTESIDGATVFYQNAEGHPQLIVRLEQYRGRWFVAATEGCSSEVPD